MKRSSLTTHDPAHTFRHRLGAIAASMLAGFGMASAVDAHKPAVPGLPQPKTTAPTDGSKLVKFSAAAEHASVPAGGSTSLALVFEVEPKWYVYWRNAGESGGPLSPTLPDVPGLRFGDMLWPTPQWHPLAGNILDFTHDKRVVLLVPVTVDAGAKPGTRLDITIPADWVVCSDVCLFGSGEASVSIVVSESGTGEAPASADTIDLFREARAQLPLPAHESSSERPQAKWDNGTLVLTAPGAERLTFFPYETNAAAVNDLLRTGRAEASELRLSFDAEVYADQSIGGVVEVEKKGRSSAFEVVIPGPE